MKQPNDCELIDGNTGETVFEGDFPDCWNHPKRNVDSKHGDLGVFLLSHEAAKKYRAALKEKAKFQKQLKQHIEKEIARVTALPSRKTKRKCKNQLKSD
jgi:hypothetical protein